MEIEAKFVIPDQDTMIRLQKVVRLGGYRLADPTTPPQQVFDRYLDTPTRALYQNGYACRIRSQNDRQTVSLKGLGEADSAIHQRFELETGPAVGLSADLQTWPPGEVRERVAQLIGDQPLEELFTVEQRRLVRSVQKNKQEIAQLSIDDVYIRAAGHAEVFWGLEIELGLAGTLDDLRVLSEYLTTTWGLIPDSLSKFHRGLELLTPSAPASPQLGAAERAELIYIAAHAPRAALRDRAQLILDWADGVPLRESFTALRRSSSWAYTWVGRFKAHHMDIFDADLLAQARAHSGLAQTTDVPAGDVEVAQEQEFTVAELCARFQTDMAHARRVADHALTLFDGLSAVHNLDPAYRPLLETMGILHDVGQESDPAHHHLVGRDILLTHRLQGMSREQQRMIAAAAYLHRKPFKPKRLHDPLIVTLSPALQQDTLTLAALLRIADGLDYTQGQTTQIDEIETTAEGVFIYVSGPYARVDAARAEAKSDLWKYRFGRPVVISCSQFNGALTAQACPEPAEFVEQDQMDVQADSVGVAAAWLARLPPIGNAPEVWPDDEISEAGRKILYFHFWRMLSHEAGARKGTDVEELHDMRVAVRRMRAALDLFEPYFKRKTYARFAARLRRTARVLGRVRDLDVLLAHARTYLETLGPDHTGDLDPLLNHWQRELAQARSSMLAYLDGVKYADWVRDFAHFLTTPGDGVRRRKEFCPTLVRHLAPELIYARWGQVQAFGPFLPGASPATLHALRIACKRLRYTLEFFRGVLGADVETVIDWLIRLQDYLGELHDADVTNTLLGEFLFAAQTDSGQVIAPGVAAYMACQQRKLQNLIAEFGPLWNEFNQPAVRHALANAVAVL